MTFNLIQSGIDTNFSTKLNSNYNSVSKQQVINALNIVDAGLYSVLSDNFVYRFIEDETTDAFVDSSGTDCYYDERGVVAFCDVLDLFEDGSVDSSIWSSSNPSTSGTPAQQTTAESGGSLNVIVQGEAGTAGGTSSRATISNGASGLDLAGADSEVILSVTHVRSNGTGSKVGKVQLSNGSTHVDLYTSSSTSPGTTNAELVIVYNDTADTVDVYVNGSLSSNDIDVSSVTTNKYLRFYAEQTNSNNNPNDSSTLKVYGVGYRKEGASAGNAIFESAVETVNDSFDSAFVVGEWRNKPSTVTAVVSFDSGANYGTDNVCEAWGITGTAGTGFQFKITGSKPTTIDATTTNIPILRSWGALVE